MTIDVVIPSTNGLELFKKHLKSVLDYTPHLGNMIVVDNASTDGSGEYLKSLSPKIKVIRNSINQYFPKAVNQGFSQSNADLVVLLNNDVQPMQNYLKTTLSLFDDEKVFAVTFNEEESSFPSVSWSGKFEYTRSKDKTKLSNSAWASGGSAIYRRKIWNILGGLDEIYSPGYWEDIDLGWSAWRSGYKIVFDPAAKVKHQHESSYSKINQKYLQMIKQRNELFFNWKHFLDKDYLYSHLWFLLRHCLLHPGYLKVVWSALKEMPKLKNKKYLYSSSEVFKIIYANE